jgi:hypothetical protein
VFGCASAIRTENVGVANARGDPRTGESLGQVIAPRSGREDDLKREGG